MLVLVAEKRGNPPSLTPEQTAALRKDLVAYREREGLTQGQLGEKIGIKQQNVARFEKGSSGASLGMQSATKAAHLLGYISADAYFAARGVALPMPELDAVLAAARDENHRMAMLFVTARGAATMRAIATVNHLVPRGEFHSMLAWQKKFTDMQASLDAAAQPSTSPPDESKARSLVPPKSRRKAASDD
jgi:transcriptional regulator with XRE-family HTH domain